MPTPRRPAWGTGLSHLESGMQQRRSGPDEGREAWRQSRRGAVGGSDAVGGEEGRGGLGVAVETLLPHHRVGAGEGRHDGKDGDAATDPGSRRGGRGRDCCRGSCWAASIILSHC